MNSLEKEQDLQQQTTESSVTTRITDANENRKAEQGQCTCTCQINISDTATRQENTEIET